MGLAVLTKGLIGVVLPALLPGRLRVSGVIGAFSSMQSFSLVFRYFLLIKQRDLKLLIELRRAKVLARDSVGNETWNLATLKAARAVEVPPDHEPD